MHNENPADIARLLENHTVAKRTHGIALAALGRASKALRAARRPVAVVCDMVDLCGGLHDGMIGIP